jgi:hypothetical protein
VEIQADGSNPRGACRIDGFGGGEMIHWRSLQPAMDDKQM